MVVIEPPTSRRDPCAERTERVRYFDSLAATRDQWIEKNWYYHHEIARTDRKSTRLNSSH